MKTQTDLVPVIDGSSANSSLSNANGSSSAANSGGNPSTSPFK